MSIATNGWDGFPPGDTMAMDLGENVLKGDELDITDIADMYQLNEEKLMNIMGEDFLSQYSWEDNVMASPSTATSPWTNESATSPLDIKQEDVLQLNQQQFYSNLVSRDPMISVSNRVHVGQTHPMSSTTVKQEPVIIQPVHRSLLLKTV